MAWFNPLSWFKPKSKKNDIPTPSDHHYLRAAEFSRVPADTGDIMVVGDSITEGWQNFPGHFPGPFANRGIAGDTTIGIIDVLPYLIKEAPKKVFILLGTNNLGWNTPAAVNRIIPDIINMVLAFKSVDAKVYVQSVLPVNVPMMVASVPQLAPGMPPSSANEIIGGRNLTNIQTVNMGLRAMEHLGATYIDLFSHFTSGDGSMDPRFTVDGLHLSDTGYKVWGEILIPYVRS